MNLQTAMNAKLWMECAARCRFGFSLLVGVKIAGAIGIPASKLAGEESGSELPHSSFAPISMWVDVVTRTQRGRRENGRQFQISELPPRGSIPG
jgi:hypothetical protein